MKSITSCGRAAGYAWFPLTVNFHGPKPRIYQAYRSGKGGRDYVRYSSCDALDEFRGVRQIIALYQNGSLENPGAVLAGLLSLGDRRINAILRLTRQSMSIKDTHEFTRIHATELVAATIEYYLDWLQELHLAGDSRRFTFVCSALHLAVLHDENGWVVDRDDALQIGFRDAVSPIKLSFEEYLPGVEKALSLLQERDDGNDALRATLMAWQLHVKTASQLRIDRQPITPHLIP